MRTLHALELPARLTDTGDASLRRALYVDFETTGLSFEHDQAIELALLPFTYAVADGRIAEVLHHEAQVHLHDPGRPLDAFITDLTGLTDDDLRGRRIDVEAANALIARSNLIVAHNARFDRPFFERALRPVRAQGRAQLPAATRPVRRRPHSARPSGVLALGASRHLVGRRRVRIS